MFSWTLRVAPRAVAATLCPEVGDHRRAVELGTVELEVRARSFGAGKGIK